MKNINRNIITTNKSTIIKTYIYIIFKFAIIILFCFNYIKCYLNISITSKNCLNFNI